MHPIILEHGDCDSQLATRSRALHASVFDLYQSLDSHSYWWIDSNYQLSEASTALLQRCFELFPDSWEIFQHTYQLLGSCKYCDVPNYYNLSGLLLLFHRHILGKHVAAEAYYTKFLRLGMGGTWYEAEDVWALQAYLQQLVGEGLRLAVDVLSKEAGGTAPSYGAWPIVAADWANPNYHIPGWEHVGYRVARQRGDVIAVKKTNDNASGHCAIAVSDTLVMGASQDSVTRGTHGLGSDATIRRYTGW